MKSAMTAAEAAFEHLREGRRGELEAYPERLRESWLWDELFQARNVRPAFRWGLWGGLLYAGLDTYLLRGRAPWTLHHHADHTRLKKASESSPIRYAKPDGVITFDRNSSVYLSNTNHEENQPCHLTLADETVPIGVNLAEQRYCPAGVYEIVREASDDIPRLQINAQNCVHCKTCDIKDPTQNIRWTVPEGGGGPSYPNM